MIAVICCLLPLLSLFVVIINHFHETNRPPYSDTHSFSFPPLYRRPSLLQVFAMILLGLFCVQISSYYLTFPYQEKSTKTNAVTNYDNETVAAAEPAAIADEKSIKGGDGTSTLNNAKSAAAATTTIDTRAWCPYAYGSTSKNSTSNGNGNNFCRGDRYSSCPQPCRRRFLIVIATGRSASTTLTWMLDSLPGVRMSGENNNLLGQLHNLYTKTLLTLMKNNDYPWGRNPMSNASVACLIQQFVETINPPPKSHYDSNEEQSERRIEEEMILGFKTIRFNAGQELRIRDLVRFIQQMLPCSRVIVNIRSDVAAQASSLNGAWEKGKSLDSIQNEIRNQNDLLTSVAQDLFGPEQARLLDSSQWTQNLTYLNDVVEWLGFSPQCRFQELLELNTNHTYGHGKTTFRSHNTGCRYLG